MATNPRTQNGSKRRKYRARFKAMALPCAICGGRLGPIHYDTSDPADPLGFVIDEKIPVSKAEQYGYASARAAAEDFENLQPAHRICNAWKSNKTPEEIRKANKREVAQRVIVSDGEW